ncbi:helix-turn-helix domain-containing protein [Arthrobacter sp. M4]|uniref:helix-turn-helix domain-containing protein n=1 Tax=Arthrobacter sp. M4 TaxID=218160 RepID=UPI001CDC62CB|nr:helix-turn-helix domain-containing protein [Arthrobacter sp. M4]MCA4132944.1 helix-turn-helix domain-containing protein [Arthrobacter sp. M4]
MITKDQSQPCDAGPSLDDLVRGPVAAAVLRSLMRDQERQMRENGAGVQVWALPVFRALQEASGAELAPAAVASFIGRVPARMGATSWLGVMEAAARTGRSERQVRRLAASGRVIAKRIGHRSWLVDIDSLENVLRNQAA